MIKVLALFPLLLIWPQDSSAEQPLHPDIAAALDWSLPENECVQPKMVARSSNIVDGDGSREITDVDNYTIRRYEKKQKRWQKCVNRYKKSLMEDFTKLKDSAQHGLTQDQANAILAKLALIQSVYLTEDALPPEPSPDEDANAGDHDTTPDQTASP